MATTSELADATGPGIISHTYHAEAHALSGKLRRPIEQEIEHQAKLVLHDLQGGHFTRLAEQVSVQGLIQFRKAHTLVSGSRSLKHNGWVTLSTSVVEELDVFEVIQADRLVSQVSTDHPYENGHVPHVTFLGTQFDNVRVSGFPLELQVDLGVCGNKPANDESYLRDPHFLRTVKEQTERIAKAKDLPRELQAEYDERLARIDGLLSASGNGSSSQHERKVLCSLVQRIGDVPIPGAKSFGNLLVLPEFGTVAFGELEVGETVHEDKPEVYFELTSLRMSLGCIGDGKVHTSIVRANGRTKP